jgi:class 3 adenylate cyclase
MRKRLEQYNQTLVAKGLLPLRHGIGIHTGLALAANIGSPDRLSYALVGDAVNLASRISDLTKKFGTDIIISADTQKELSHTPKLRSLPVVQVKGKSQAVEVFALE